MICVLSSCKPLLWTEKINAFFLFRCLSLSPLLPSIFLNQRQKMACATPMQLTRSSLTVIALSPAYLPPIIIEIYCKGDRMCWGTECAVYTGLIVRFWVVRSLSYVGLFDPSVIVITDASYWLLGKPNAPGDRMHCCTGILVDTAQIVGKQSYRYPCGLGLA